MYLGNGCTLLIGTTNTVSEITFVTSPGYEGDTLDTTTHNNSNRFRTFIKGLIDAGTIDFDGLASSTNVGMLEGFAATTTTYSVTVTMPTGPSVSKFECNGHFESFKVNGPHDDLLDFSAAIKISGKPTFSKV
jgi:hypothetical protein